MTPLASWLIVYITRAYALPSPPSMIVIVFQLPSFLREGVRTEGEKVLPVRHYRAISPLHSLPVIFIRSPQMRQI